MNIVCLDLEGVLVPEIWIAFAEASGIPELKRTTRDEPDYDKLMKYRLDILDQHGLGLKEIQETIATIDPMPGAKLGWPAIFCNELVVDENGKITDYKLRCEKTKLTTVRALQSCGFETIASGDSFNDLAMIQASKAGFLFRAPDSIKADYPDIPACDTYDELLTLIKSAL